VQIMKCAGLLLRACCAFFGLVWVGCSGDSKPRPLEEIQQEQLSLPALYLTYDDKREVIASGDQGDVIVDKDSGKLAFRAWTCTNPDCPGKKPAGQRPLLFIWHDPLYFVDESGSVNYDAVPNRAEMIVKRGGHLEPTCPECLKIRDGARETPAVEQQYRDWCQQYVLPTAASRSEELRQEVRARREYIESRTAERD
jgi:hypothetical protein